jgi:polyvinyl alcohol dehydrogenase (cytochrome)
MPVAAEVATKVAPTTATAVLIFALLSLSACAPQDSAEEVETAAVSDPAALYEEHCAQCHRGGVPKAPHEVAFQMLGSKAILASMNAGSMQQEASVLTADQRQTLANHLGGDRTGAPEPLICSDDRRAFDQSDPPAVAGWGFTPASTRFIPAEVADLSASEVSRLQLKWAFAYPDATRARSQPVVAAGSVFVGSQHGSVYALDLETGCVRWSFAADAEVRSAVSVSDWTDGADARVYFGDFKANVYAVSAWDGELIWRTRVDDHPGATITGSPRLYEDTLYVPVSSTEWSSAADPAYACCTFRGAVVALDTSTGEQRWKTYSIAEAPAPTGELNPAGAARHHPAGAPIWNSPTIDVRRNRLYVGTGQAYTSPAASTSDAVLAIDLEDGELLWSYQATAGDAWNMACFIGQPANCPEENGPDLDIGASPVLVTLKDGTDVLLAGQKSGVIHALDPDNDGELLWQKRIGRGGFVGGVHWGMAAANGTLFAPNADTDFVGKWPGERKPGLFALDVRTGEILWFTPAPDACDPADRPACDPGLSAAATAIPGVVFAGAFDGHLRAYDAQSGAIIWDYDTNRAFDTLSGEQARGGSISADGPLIAHGHLLINSGYLFGGRMPGNVLLAFTAEGEPSPAEAVLR